ncbi:IS110 family transposase [Neorhodopirellula pilleata]|uniref:Transposase n=1 Tax=Neorhodopirellula pilleata TaxID=2714738 RepID=A0A5C6A894_9BACT|nr:transposase [Neorhodopirellula pilleata]TWT95607.1 Transposase [Neorhodopirellula pilleata]
MATATQKRNRKSNKPTKTNPSRYIGKPAGVIQARIREAGPQHFAVISVDCAKARSVWMICDYYGKVLVEPTPVEHQRGAFDAMIGQIHGAFKEFNITDSIAAVEMTGVYHRPVQAALRKAGFDTRTVHPFASKHYRKPLHPNLKTDENDLEAIFHAAINGYGLSLLPVDPVYQSLQALSRHRVNLVKQRAKLQVQIRILIHQTMPGFADLFIQHHFFKKSIAIPVAKAFPSAAFIAKAGTFKIAESLRKQKVRFQQPTIERIVAWSKIAAEPSDLQAMLSVQWQQLIALWELLTEQIGSTEREMAGFLVRTPYVLLMSVRGINVVSAASLAGEAGPIEHYASPRAINGRAGLYPSRYQSDQVDCQGGLARVANRRLRAACMMVAKNLIKCHPYYRGLSAYWEKQKVDPRDRHVRIANRANRMVYQLVGGRQIWRGKGVDREAILSKLREFHRDHHSDLEQMIADMNEAFLWLPKSTYASEAKPLAELAAKKRCGPQPIGDLLINLLLRLGVGTADPLESQSSEALES